MQFLIFLYSISLGFTQFESTKILIYFYYISNSDISIIFFYVFYDFQTDTNFYLPRPLRHYQL